MLISAPRKIPPLSFEAATWRGIDGQWTQLFGDFARKGVSIEWHDFDSDHALPWSPSFHPDSLEICLNELGSGEMAQSAKTARIEPQNLGYYFADGARAERLGQQRHRFVTFEFSRHYLATHLGEAAEATRPDIKAFIQGKPFSRLGSVQPLNLRLRDLSMMLRDAPVARAAAPIWFQSKVLDVLAEIAFERPVEPELFCTRQKRLARERVTKAKDIIQRDVGNPPSLEQLGRQVGCSPFYLSRLFSQQAGMTIPRYLREIRIERAAEMLHAGTHNVTEAAFEVGYSSLSHFSKAFCETKGCCPGLFPSAKVLVERSHGNGKPV